MKVFFRFWFCFGVLFSATLYAEDDDQENKTAAKTSASQNGQALLVLDKTAQAAAGLKTIKLKAVAYRPELLSYGTAISIEPLVSIQNQYRTALAQQSSAAAKAKFSQNNINRLTYLHNEQIISTRALQDQQATLQVDKAALDSSHYLKQQIISTSRLVWGEKLTDWMINATPAFTALTQQHSILLKITFPPEIGSSHSLKNIFVATGGQREQAVVAELISAVPQADNFSQGQQYFYQAPANHIKTGMRVSAWIPSGQQPQTGVMVPASAVCWHLGQALVFVKVTAQQFSHRAISTQHKTAGGYFVSSGLKNAEEIVSTGAQMLLSQELKGQIPDEDDD